MRWLPGIGFLLALLSGAGGFLWWSGDEGLLSATTPQSMLLTTLPACQLDKGSCQADAGTARLVLSLSPIPVPVMQPVQVNAELQGFGAVQTVDIRVTGVNMYMGEQSAQLQALDESFSRWQGTFMLPLCTSDIMDWLAAVHIATPDGNYQVVIPFQTRSR
ncbi:MAG: hypothetical protein KDI44_03965 [Thiothrix sp.]|nr:hypothetical protein [Thiothrix sp.]HPQ96445.1 hypothetical protein [Thiolinea sp.]